MHERSSLTCRRSGRKTAKGRREGNAGQPDRSVPTRQLEGVFDLGIRLKFDPTPRERWSRPKPRNQPQSHTRLTNRRIGSKLIVGVSNGKRHTPNTLYCNALSVLVAFVLGFHISAYEVTGRDLRLCEWWERANAVAKAFFRTWLRGKPVRHLTSMVFC